MPWGNQMKGKLRRLFSVSNSALAFTIVVCSPLGGCSPGERTAHHEVAAASPAATSPLQSTAIDATARIPIAQARGVVVMSDPERRARAFENGLVGQPRPLADAEAIKPPRTAQVAQCNLPPGEPCDPPPPTPKVSAQTMGTDVIRVTFTCGDDANTFVRTSPNYEVLPAPCVPGTFSDTGLTQGTRYCYAMQNSDGSYAAGPHCATTLWNPFVFNGPGLSQSESDQMAASFNWTHTNPIGTTIPTSSGDQTALYSMNM